MKKLFKYTFIALAGLSILACKQEILPKEEEKTIEEPSAFTYTIAADITKSHLAAGDDHFTWQNGDQIGWFINDGNPGCSAIDFTTTPYSFKVSSATALPANSTVYAFAPCYAAGIDRTAAELSIPVHQGGDAADCMPMVSLPIEIADPVAANTDEPIAQASFINLGAVIEYNVYTSDNAYSSEKVQSIKFESTSGAIAGDFSVNLTTVSESNIPAPSSLTETEVISTLATAATVGTSKAAGIKVYQVVAPNTWSGTLTVTTDAATYTYTITNMEFNRSKIKPISVNLASANATRTPIYNLTAEESILVGSKWKLVDYYESWDASHITDDYNIVTGDYGGTLPNRLSAPRLLFYPNHAFALENFGFYKDYNGINLDGDPASADGKWELTSNNTTLHFSQGAFPIVIVTSGDLMSVDWTVNSLTSQRLHIYAYSLPAGQWANLIFEPDGANNNPVPQNPPTQYSYDHSFAAGDFGLTDQTTSAQSLTDTIDGKEWTLSNNVGAYKINTPWAWAGTVIWNGDGWSSLPLEATLSSSAFGGTIKSIGLDITLGEGTSATVSCTVGGAAFGTSKTINNSDGENPQQSATITGSATGNIVITLTQPDTNGMPLMIRGVHVTYLE